jgi:hypothetical protein
MNTAAPMDFEPAWGALSLQARLAVVVLIAEQAAIDHGIGEELAPIDHGWMVVEGVHGSESLITTDAFAALISAADGRTPPGFLEAVHGLIDAPSNDGAARTFLSRCNPRDVTLALATVHEAVTRGTDLTPPAVLRQEFRRQRGSA